MRANAATLSVPVRSSIILRIVAGFAKVVGRVRKYCSQRANIATLYAMSDRELKDIGLSRSDLHRITSL
jgi:uncharacterized protein YjiS (DUF1127 family)